MKKYKVIFASMTRDNMDTLPHLVEELERLGQLFKDFAFVFAENDSSDNTKEYLDKLGKEKDYPVVRTGQDFYNKKRPSISFLAKMRNFYLREIYTLKYDDYDYVIVFDADFQSLVTKQSVADTFDRAGWDAVAGLGELEGKLFDAFAFRNDEFNRPYVPEKYDNDITKYFYSFWKQPSAMVHYDNGPLIPVYSAFGGLAIYKKSTLQGLLHDETSEDCEHVSLHSQIRAKGGNIFMNPNMRLQYTGLRRYF